MVRRDFFIVWLLSLPAAASCGSAEPVDGPDAGSPVDSPDAGLPFDFLPACVERCINGVAAACPFGYPASTAECEPWCTRIFENAGPQCQDKLLVDWACNVPLINATQEYCVFPMEECQVQHWESSGCVNDLGCGTFGWDNSMRTCIPKPLGPNGEAGCECTQRCVRHKYTSACWTEGTTTKCECHEKDGWNFPYAKILIGTCEGGPVCDEQVYKGCCNQFYNIPFE